jgi:hypothetical protein
MCGSLEPCVKTKDILYLTAPYVKQNRNFYIRFNLI